MDGDAALGRRVDVRVSGLAHRPYVLRHWRIDAEHSNVAARWRSLGGVADWPDHDEWGALAAGDTLDELEPPRRIVPVGGVAELAVELPMPAISYLALSVA